MLSILRYISVAIISLIMKETCNYAMNINLLKERDDKFALKISYCSQEGYKLCCKSNETLLFPPLGQGQSVQLLKVLQKSPETDLEGIMHFPMTAQGG